MSDATVALLYKLLGFIGTLVVNFIVTTWIVAKKKGTTEQRDITFIQEFELMRQEQRQMDDRMKKFEVAFAALTGKTINGTKYREGD